MSDPEPPIMEYREEEGIHIFTFHSNSRAAAEAYLVQLRQIGQPHKATNGTAPLYLVIDISEKGMFSLAHMKRQLQNRSDRMEIPLYIAYLGNSDSDEFLMQLLGSMLPQLKNQRRIFKPDQLDDAIAWLRALGAPFSSEA